MSKTVLITGASSGIGAASIEALLACGHTVYASALMRMFMRQERNS
jgi:NAD(P)-dependent dehydrogenase (short-subunit alcohol dehydrogenase family)